MKPISYSLSFEDTIELLTNEMRRWFSGPKSLPPDIEQFPEPVFFKSSDAVIVR